jgi:abortive infection bacteriophage resistance protein
MLHSDLFPEILGGWLHNLAYVRNIYAHHNRLWNRTLAIRPRCPKRWAYGKIDNTNVYLLLIVLHYIISRIAPESTWSTRLVQLVDTYPHLDIAAMGFPPDWKSSEPWLTVAGPHL